ncbi:hypothetical protein [Flavihumibacter sp. UBA7668]|uniref:hypothetical protein n=1 Tax=Flavihumibacter sp. UBA7668 TaxID=1946542 RepID=UPI0025BCB611|nr:hypothetical protein [Flavihumibacter sp. UBA7668]
MKNILFILIYTFSQVICQAQNNLKDEAGNTYSGAFLKTDFTGQGTCKYADGSSYTGGWKDGLFNGQGTYTWTNGDSYTGNWENGERQGKGTLTTASREKFEGHWEQDQLEGKITWYNAKKELIYEGEWLNGQPHGEGTYHSSPTETYAGQFKNGERIEGTLIVRIGKNTLTYTGQFKEDEIFTGKISYPDGSTYVGSIRDRAPNGAGKIYVEKNGIKEKTYNGIWIYGNQVQAREYVSSKESYPGLFSTYQMLEAALNGDAKAMYTLGLFLVQHKEFEPAVKWLQKSADAGYGPALYKLGQAYIDAEWVKEDKPKALGLKLKAISTLMAEVNGRDENVWVCLGLHYAQIQKYEEALELFKKAANQNNPEAMMAIGAFYENGFSVAKNLKTAEEWFIKAAETPDIRAQHYLADQYQNGTFPKSAEQQTRWLIAAGLNGSAAAYFELGQLNYDKKIGLGYFQNAAALGNVTALYRAANYYLWGYAGISIDVPRGIQLMETAVEKGSVDAMLAMADVYQYNRHNLGVNEAKAIHYYELATRQGSLRAYEELASIYIFPSFGTKGGNYQRGVEWAKKGAALGSGKCHYLMGAAYYDARGVPKDHATAVSWYRKGAELGDASCMHYLGDAYQLGHGVKKNKKLAAYWHQKSVETLNKK